MDPYGNDYIIEVVEEEGEREDVVVEEVVAREGADGKIYMVIIAVGKFSNGR
jgi:hypothetical protein